MKSKIWNLLVSLTILLIPPNVGNSLPLCPTDQQQFYDNCFGKYVFPKESDWYGDFYLGEFQNNEFIGLGGYFFNDGDSFFGEFKNGVAEGQGTYNYSDGLVFVGGLKDWNRHGVGTLITSEAVFVGNYELDRRKGMGLYANKEGDVFIGNYKNNKRDGVGHTIFGSGSKFVGWFNEGKRSGTGVFSGENEIYIGGYLNGKRHGTGYYIWHDGSADFCKYVDGEDTNCIGSNVYDVAPNLKNSFSQLSTTQRKKIQSNLSEMGLYQSGIDGKWGKNTFVGLLQFAAVDLNTTDIRTSSASDFLLQRALVSTDSSYDFCPSNASFDWNNCIGSFTFDNGNTYIGYWRENEKHGLGLITFPNGANYIGEWDDNSYQGQGVYTFSDGERHAGRFVNGNMNGHGTYLFSSGSKQTGNFSKSNITGVAAYIYSKGDIFVGEYANNVKKGSGSYIFGTDSKWAGDSFIGQYADNAWNGFGTYTYADGDQFTGNFQNDNRHGKGVMTYANGTTFTGEYRNDRRNGVGTIKFADGSTQTGTWINGELQETQPNSMISEDTNSGELQQMASGTGFYVSEEGHIVTNFHVIQGCTEVRVRGEGKDIVAIQIAEDQLNDLALLKIFAKPDYVFALSKESPFPLQEIIVAGFPFGERYSSALKFTKGIVSSLSGIGDNYSEIQIDAALQQGNSGGPIVDEYGNVIAVAVAKLDAKYMFENYGVIPENTNFGVKASAVLNFLEANRINLKSPRNDVMSSRDLSTVSADGTVYLSCWMTDERIAQMKNKRVMVEN